MPDGSISDIERRVAADRAALARSLDLLSNTLSPDRLKEEAARTAETYGTDISRQLWDATRENPAAFALVGAGIALLVSGTGRRADDDAVRAPQAVDPVAAMDGFDARVAAADAQIRAESTGLTEENLSAGRMRAALDRGLESLPPAARQRVRKARLAAIRAQEAVERRAAKISRQSADIVHKQPIAVGAAAFGVGALLAAVLPNTRREDALMGQHRDALMRDARAALHAEMEAVRDALADDAPAQPGRSAPVPHIKAVDR
ncbi:MAG: hypothetical protein AAFQ39_11385 [Pseudomonadota bacterium]